MKINNQIKEIEKLRKFKDDFESNIQVAMDREIKAKERLENIRIQIKEIKKDNKLTLEAYNDVCEERDVLRKWRLKSQKQINQAEKIRVDLRIADVRIDYLEQGIKEVQGELEKKKLKVECICGRRFEVMMNEDEIDKIFGKRFGEIK